MARQTVPVIGVPVPAPRHLHKVPWKRIALWTIVLIMLAVAALGTRELVSRVTSGDAPVAQTGQQVQVGPAPVVNPPAQNPQPEAVVPSAPREIEVPWVLLGTGPGTTETMNRLGIPWEKWVVLTGPAPGRSYGLGDGTAYFVHDFDADEGRPYVENPKLYFTPDAGRTWFQVVNPYPGESITVPSHTGKAAMLKGDSVVLFLSLQPEPFVESWWRAEIPLAELKGLAP